MVGFHWKVNLTLVKVKSVKVGFARQRQERTALRQASHFVQQIGAWGAFHVSLPAKVKDTVEKSKRHSEDKSKTKNRLELVENKNLRLYPERQGLARKWAHLAQGRVQGIDHSYLLALLSLPVLLLHVILQIQLY